MPANFAALHKTLMDSLHLTLAPVTVTMTDTPPKDVPPFAGRVAAGCVFWEQGASKSFVTSSKDHDLCAIGTHTHNMPGTAAHEADRMDALKVFADLGYLPMSELPGIPVLKDRRQHAVYGPLADAKSTPDVVLLFVKANQTLILSEAVTGVDGSVPPALGRPACAIVPQAVNTQRAALSLGCCGARAYVDALTDDVALFALPGAKLEAYAARIAELAKANAVLSTFHTLRRKDVTHGKSPTIKESLATLQKHA